MSWITTFAAGLLGLVVLLITVILTATLWPRRHPFREKGRTLQEHRAREIANGVVFDQTYPCRPTHFDISDGGRITARVFGPKEASDIVVLVHGIGAAGARWNNPAGLLSGATGAQIIAIDLRGHNESSGPRHDLDRIGQYEDDLAVIIAALQADRPDARIWLAGHSMGGGIVLRFALKPDRPRIAGYLLLAPVFGPGPTTPRVPPDDPVLRVDRARMMGLILLNLLSIRTFNHLPVAFLNTPPEFPAYSFAAMASALPMPPKTAEDGLNAMEGPFLIVAGAEDVSVRAEGYLEITTRITHGQVDIRQGHGHDSLLNDSETYSVVSQWFEQSKWASFTNEV